MKYNVTATVVGSKYLGEFEADSPDEAAEMARNSTAASIGFCHQCAEHCEDPEVTAVLAELASSGENTK